MKVFDSSDFELINRDFESLMESVRKRCENPDEVAVVKRAFEFANEAHKNVRRRSGEPYILHPIAVARIVVDEIGLGYKSISAALLHDVVEDTDYTVADIKNLFGDKIAQLVDGLTKIKNVFENQHEYAAEVIQDNYATSVQAENFKRILLTLNDDARIILIKMADRLHNCRTIEFMPEYKRDKILSETMFIFIPIANRLGLYSIKTEMENIWLRYKEPVAYKDISDRVNQKIKDSDKEMDAFVKPLQEALEGKFDFIIKKRVKTPYSIWRKMQSKHVSFDQVYDLYAIRIIFNHDKESTQTEREECFHIYSIITSIYTARQDRFRDWVSHTKSNGYEALHCTLMDSKGFTVEVQIRSKRMDDIAERGLAAHWSYKKDGYISDSAGIDHWFQKVHDTLNAPNMSSSTVLEELHNELMSGEIVVFTPKGAQKIIPKDSTVLDFAYQIHTEIGYKAIAAKVNLKTVALNFILHSGDIVEVITAEQATPRREQLAFLRTRTARNRVIDWFRKDFNAIRDEGMERCAKDFNMIGIDVTKNYLLAKLASRKGFNNADEFLFWYGLHLLKLADVSSIAASLLKNEGVSDNTAVMGHEIELTNALDYDGIIKIATCCNPIAGDPVIGFKNPDDGTVVIHKKSCKVAELEAAMHGDRIILPQWSKSSHQYFLVRIKIDGIDKMGMLNEITRYISLIMGVNIKAITIGANNNIVTGHIDLYVHDREVLEALMKHLRGINGITNVERQNISMHE